MSLCTGTKTKIVYMKTFPHLNVSSGGTPRFEYKREAMQMALKNMTAIQIANMLPAFSIEIVPYSSVNNVWANTMAASFKTHPNSHMSEVL